MCRMLGIIGPPPLGAKEAMEAFLPLCRDGCVKQGMASGHRDGWGASGYRDGRAVYFGRKAQSADTDNADYALVSARAAKAKSPVLIAHFRKASSGEISLSNTQPFHYRDWVFAHNGMIFGAAASFQLNESAPLGDTDSERFFLWLWEQVHAALDPTPVLASLLKKYRDELVFTSLNFLMSDGTMLWAYRDYGDKRLQLGETMEERQKYYSIYTAKAGTASLVCSEPLERLASPWTPLPQRTLAAFSWQTASPQLIKI